MSESAHTVTASNGQAGHSATDLVRRFLELLQAGEVAAATDLLATDVRYMNASLPTVQGRERVRRIFERMFALPGTGFEVYFHTISAEGTRVLCERTDVLVFGPVRIQIWVCGRFDVVGGRITVWKDYFDWLNCAVATLRGLLGAVVPALAPRPPAAHC